MSYAKSFKFEVIIDFFEDHEMPDEDFIDLTALYYGDKHQSFGLTVVPGTITEVRE